MKNSTKDDQDVMKIQNQTEYLYNTISQNDVNKKIEEILKEFPNFDNDICLILLRDSYYDTNKAKKEARTIYNYDQQNLESTKKKLLRIFKIEFPQEQDLIIEKAIKLSCCNYKKAKFFIINDLGLEKNHKKSNKKHKKRIICDSDQIFTIYTSNKKIKKSRSSIQSTPKFNNWDELCKSHEKSNKSISNLGKISQSNKLNQFYNEPDSLDDNNRLKHMKSSQIKLSDTRIQNNNNNYDDDYIAEKEFYQNIMSSVSSSSKFSVNKTNRIPDRYTSQPNMKVKEIDLHGMKADDVQVEVNHALDNAKNSNHGSICFITGVGHHSKNNIPVLRPLVYSICKKKGFTPYFSKNRGCITVYIK